MSLVFIKRKVNKQNNRMKLLCKSRVYYQIQKSLDDSKLDYFKDKILEILDRQEKNEEAVESLFMEKGRIACIGEIRVWNGKKYKKMPDKKWVRIYDNETHGARLSIAALKRQVGKCTDSQMLLNLVLENKDRFCDILGRPLPIVQELSENVYKKNGKLETLPKERTQEEHSKDLSALKRRNADEYNKKRAEHIRQDRKLNAVTYNQELLTRKEAEFIVDKYKNKKITNEETSLSADYGTEGAGKLVSRKAVGKSKKNGYTEEEHFTIASHIKELFEKSNLISIEPDRDSDLNDNVKEVRRYAIEFNLNDRNGFALMTVKINKDGTQKLYALELNHLKEKKPATSSAVKEKSSHETLNTDKPRNQQVSKKNISYDDRIVKISESSVEKKLSDFELKKKIYTWAKESLQGKSFKNRNDNSLIRISRDGIDEWKSKTKTREQILSLKVLDKMLENAVRTHSREDKYKKNNRNYSYDYYKCRILINGKNYNAIITTRVILNDDKKYYHHFLEDIKMEPVSGFVRPNEVGNAPLLTGSAHGITPHGEKSPTDSSIPQNGGKSNKSGYVAGLRKQLKDELKNKLGFITNESGHVSAMLSNGSLDKMTSDKAIEKSKNNGFAVAEHFELVRNIVELFKKALLLKRHQDNKKVDLDLEIERYINKNIGLSTGKKADAYITVKHTLNPDGRKIYSLEALDIKKPLQEQGRVTNSPENSSRQSASTNISQKGGKSINKSFTEEINEILKPFKRNKLWA